MPKHQSLSSKNSKKTGLTRNTISAIAYDKTSGKILLIHHFSILPERREHSLESIRKEVTKECSEMGNMQNMRIEIIFSKPNEFVKTPMKVDLQSKSLIKSEKGFSGLLRTPGSAILSF